MEAELLTAVLAGDRTMEVRIFGTEDITEEDEKELTGKLCRLMSANKSYWKR